MAAHAPAPGQGSEPGISWGWAWHLSEQHEVWVIAHPQFRPAVEAVTSQHGDRAPRMIWVDLPKWLDPFCPARGDRGIRLHYLLWQHAALEQARRLHATQGFDIVHHVGLSTVNAPPALWRLGAPFVWGPIGGGQAAPLAFGRHLGRSATLAETGRTIRRRLLPLLPSLRRAVANSAVILATNRETADILYRAGAQHVELYLDGGVWPEEFIARQRVRRAGEPFELLWAGTLEPRKALSLALEALAGVSDLPVRLTIAGDGPLRATHEHQAAALGLGDRVRFLGQVPRTTMRALFAASDAFLFTSLQDSFGTVVIEAMAAGLPLLALKHQGVGAMIPDRAAIRVPVTSPAATILGLSDGIRALATSPDLERRMGRAARCHAASESWHRRVGRMNELYRCCLESRDGRARVSQGHRNRTRLAEGSSP